MLHTLNRLDEKERCYVKGAVTIDAPLESFSTWLHIGKNRLYDLWLLRNYKHMVKRRAIVDSLSEEDIKILKNIKTKRQFMDTYKYTFGYPKKTFTFEEYVKATDVPLAFFRKNTMPLLLICSYDDPIVPTEVYPKKDIADNPYIVTLFTKYGGHGGFFTFQSRYGDLDGHWAHNRAIEFMRLLAAYHKSLA